MITAEAFADYVGEDYSTSDRTADLDRSVAVASALLNEETDGFNGIPGVVADQLVLDVALAIYQRSSNNNGLYEAESPAGPLDPLQRVRTILDRYRLVGL